MNTKGKIIELSIKLFNQFGFNSISLQEIANNLNISRGNLTYHFKDKDFLLKKIIIQMWLEFEKEKQTSRVFPSFENLHNEIKIFYVLQNKYSFIFLDSQMSSHPIIKSKLIEMMQTSVEQNKATILFSIQLGNMKPEVIKGSYNNLAFSVWMISSFWLFQQRILGDESIKDAEKMIWSLLLPFFTEKGIKSFKNFFGNKYFSNIGESFNYKIEQFTSKL